MTEYFDATAFDDMLFAIEEMVVRGAPSIGVAAAYGLAWEAERLTRNTDPAHFLETLEDRAKRLKATRPTAVNLAWAVDLMIREAHMLFERLNAGASRRDLEQVAIELKKLAVEILNEHIEINKRLSDFGAALVADKAQILTHCNAGSLAACGWGTALGVIRSAFIQGRQPTVLVDETRPRQQGARLTMWELSQDNIPATLVCESMAGHLMQSGKVNMVIVGADRIARNGDTANKIGTYNLAVLAKYHDIPFYVAAPLSTFDADLESGACIPIEHRSEAEVTSMAGVQLTVSGARAYNPAFDVTPADLITAIITEAGILRRPFKESIQSALGLSG